MDFYDRLEELLILLESKSGLSKHRILIEAGVDPSQFRAYKNAGRSLSKPMLTSLAEYAYCPYSLDVLLAWKVIHEYGEGPIKEAAKLLKKEKC